MKRCLSKKYGLDFFSKARDIYCVSARFIAPSGRVPSRHTTYITSLLSYHSYLSTLNMRYARISADTISAMFSAVPIRAVPFSVM